MSTVRTESAVVVPLAGVGRRDVVTAGGKGAHLGELIRAGFPVPSGFVVTTSGYRWATAGTRFAAAAAASVSDGGAGMRAAVSAVKMPGALADGIAAAYASLGAGPVAVRSSATGRATGSRLLGDDTLRELAMQAGRVEQLFGAPQDIEWAIGDGGVQILQARPMTAVPIPLKLNRVQRFIGGVFADYFSVRPYPLDMTTWVPHGPVGMMDDFLSGLGLAAHLDRILPERDGVVVQFVPPSPRPTWRALALPVRVLSRARRYDSAAWTRDPRYLAFDAARARLLRADVRRMSWGELLQTARDAMRLVEPITQLRSSYLPAFGRSILLLRWELARLRAVGLMGALISGAPTHTAAGNRRLEDLARIVREDAALGALFQGQDSADILRRVRESRDFAGFADAFADYLAEFGYRETESPVLISSRTWGDRPELVVDLIKVLAAGGADRPAASQLAAHQAEAELLALPRLARPRRRERVLKVVAAARAGVGFREDSHSAFTRLAPVLRSALLELGQRLTRRTVIADPFDVFHLRFDELESVADIEVATARQCEALAGLVRERAAKRADMAAVPMVNHAAIFPPRPHAGGALLSGTPAGAGVATGPARIILGAADFGSLQSGDVLVCPYTNPAWTPLFQRAAAVVADTGGIGSHAAIVARENGIPAVMGTGTGTRTLTNGQRVRVDGTAGTVTLA